MTSNIKEEMREETGAMRRRERQIERMPRAANKREIK
jgi:hypothetical protein